MSLGGDEIAQCPRSHPAPPLPRQRCHADTCVRASDGDAPQDQRVPRESSHLLFWGELVQESSAVCSHGRVTSFVQETYFTAGHFRRSWFIRGCASGIGSAGRCWAWGCGRGQGWVSGFSGLNIQREGVAGAQKPNAAPAWTISFLVTSPCACCWLARVRGGGSGPGPLPLRLQNLAEPRRVLPCQPPTAGWSTGDHCGDSTGPGLDTAVGIYPSSGQAQPCSPETERHVDK